MSDFRTIGDKAITLQEYRELNLKRPLTDRPIGADSIRHRVESNRRTSDPGGALTPRGPAEHTGGARHGEE